MLYIYRYIISINSHFSGHTQEDNNLHLIFVIPLQNREMRQKMQLKKDERKRVVTLLQTEKYPLSERRKDPNLMKQYLQEKSEMHREMFKDFSKNTKKGLPFPELSIISCIGFCIIIF